MKPMSVRGDITEHFVEAGVDKRLAKAFAEPLAQLHENMVTKDDLVDFATKGDLAVAIAELEVRLVRQQYTLLGIYLATLVAVLTIFGLMTGLI